MQSVPPIGHYLGPYKVLEKIAQGGMGEIYKGFHPGLDRYVAIKLLGSSLKADPALTQRFQREAKAAAGLRHPNIVQVFDFGFAGDTYYMVMEYVEGTDLRAEIDERRRNETPFTRDEILPILGQVADALDYAHQHGIIHRDVKPANILLTSDGQAILGDFGLVMLRDRASQATLGHSFGTPEYIAPEQAIDSRAAVPQSDIYSLGGILYEMVTGRLPFEAESSISLAMKHISEEPAPPRRYVSDLPPAVEVVILRALAKEPGRRFDTAHAMIEALRKAWAGAPVSPAAKPIHPTAPSLAQRVAPPPADATQAPLSPPTPTSAAPLAESALRRRWPLVAGLLALLVIGVIGILVFGRGRNPFAVAAVTPTATASPAATSTSLPLAPSVEPTSSPPSVAVVVLADTTTPAPTTTPTSLPTSTATPRPTATRTPTVTASPAPTATATSTPTSTATPTLAPGQVITRALDGMTMRFVPGGPFLMGTDDADAPSYERPQHPVILSPFWMDQTEVTNAQYQLCVKAGTCTAPVIRAAFDDPARSNQPVVNVNWNEASTYYRWLSKPGWDAHLPTEAQWEKAASWDPSTGTKRRYPWGDQEPDPALLNFLGSTVGHPTDVGSYAKGASPYGILDMAGNVFEWVADWFDPTYYRTATSPLTDPSGPASGSERVMRGGSHGYGSGEARTTYRTTGNPEKARGDGLGFRCAVSGERLP